MNLVTIEHLSKSYTEPVSYTHLDVYKRQGLAERLKNVCSGRKENKLYLRD